MKFVFAMGNIMSSRSMLVILILTPVLVAVFVLHAEFHLTRVCNKNVVFTEISVSCCTLLYHLLL